MHIFCMIPYSVTNLLKTNILMIKIKVLVQNYQEASSAYSGKTKDLRAFYEIIYLISSCLYLTISYITSIQIKPL